MRSFNHPEMRQRQIYTSAQRKRRDTSVWTIIQGILAPVQFLIFLVSLGLIVRYLLTGTGYEIATWSIVAKTIALYSIMVTGAIWEKHVFGKYLFADSFFWEDAFSMIVIALHTAYLACLIFSLGTPQLQLTIAFAAYGTYLINAGQFLWKLRLARLQGAQSRNAKSPTSSVGPTRLQSEAAL